MSQVNVHLKTGSRPNDCLNNSYGLIHSDLEGQISSQCFLACVGSPLVHTFACQYSVVGFWGSNPGIIGTICICENLISHYRWFVIMLNAKGMRGPPTRTLPTWWTLVKSPSFWKKTCTKQTIRTTGQKRLGFYFMHIINIRQVRVGFAYEGFRAIFYVM